MVSKSPICVLSLDSWMKYYTDDECGIEERLGSKKYHPIPPVFHREGYYWNRLTDTCWYERGGQAFSVPSSEMFRYKLSLLNARQLSSREILAYREMLHLSVPQPLRKQIMGILYLDSQVKHLRNIRFDYLRFPHGFYFR